MSEVVRKIHTESHRHQSHQYFRLEELLDFVDQALDNGAKDDAIVWVKRYSYDRGAEDASRVHLEITL